MRLIQLLVVRACLGVGRPLSGLAGGLVRHLRELKAELEARPTRTWSGTNADERRVTADHMEVSRGG
jgi:hypothetical protein